jgi:hypothetical protein
MILLDNSFEQFISHTQVNPAVSQYFMLGSFVKMAKLAQFFGVLFYHCKKYVLIVTKKLLGYVLGDFFTNASGHPA